MCVCVHVTDGCSGTNFKIFTIKSLNAKWVVLIVGFKSLFHSSSEAYAVKIFLIDPSQGLQLG